MSFQILKSGVKVGVQKRMHGSVSSVYGYEKAKFKLHTEISHDTVSTVKKLQCGVCNESFANSRNLRFHSKAKHQPLDTSKYECDICGKYFTREYGVKLHKNKVHSKVHKTEMKFQCSKCGKHFKRENQVKCHIESVHQNVRYECQICRKKYVNTKVLREHISKNHLNSI